MKPKILTPIEEKNLDKFIYYLLKYMNTHNATFEYITLEYKKSPIITTNSIHFVVKDKSDPEYVHTHFSFDLSEKPLKDLYTVIKKVIKEVHLTAPKRIEHRIQPYLEERPRLYNRNQEIFQGSLIPFQLNQPQRIFIIDWSYSINTLYFWYQNGKELLEFPQAIKSAPLDKFPHLRIKNF